MGRRFHVGPRLAVLGLFALLAVAHTWPLASRPGVYSRVDNGDYSLNVWAVDWVAHTLPVRPSRLFDANIFHPARLTLAYSEPLILQGALAIPAAWAGVSPIAAFNFVLIAGLALTGWAFALFVHRATGSWMAAAVSGSAVAFNAHHLVRLVHVQALHLELVPLVFLALDRLVASGRGRDAAVFGAAVAAQALQSIYLLVFCGWAAIGAWVARWSEWRGRRRTAVTSALIAAAVCALAVMPLLWPYIALARTEGMVRNLQEAQRCSASWTDYLYTGSRVHYDAWSHRFSSSADANFPGLVVTALAIWALLGGGVRTPRVRAWLGVVTASVLLSVSPRLPGFAWLHEQVPLLGGIRCYSRAGQLALVGVGVLAGFGAARLAGQLASRRTGALAAAALVAAINIEALRAPLWYQPFAGIPAIYDRLRDEPRAVVIELPLYGRRWAFRNADYMLYATRHRHPLVNGYSGFTPPAFDQTAAVMRTFPDFAALEVLHTLGVTHVVIHRTPEIEPRWDEIQRHPSLSLIADEAGMSLFRFVDR